METSRTLEVTRRMAGKEWEPAPIQLDYSDVAFLGIPGFWFTEYFL